MSILIKGSHKRAEKYFHLLYAFYKANPLLFFTMTNNFFITNCAAKRIAWLKSQEKNSQHLKLRVSVISGGCSGFQYSFSLDNKTQEGDHVFEKGGIEVVVDDLSVGFLREAQLDFVEDLVSSKFVVKNPNTSTSCGCGHSFSV